MKLRKIHYDYYVQRKIKSLAGYVPKHRVSLNALINGEATPRDLDEINNLVLLRLLRKNYKDKFKLKSELIRIGQNSTNCRKGLFLRIAKKI